MTGSSPRVRGKDGLCARGGVERGIIPAGAGKSVSELEIIADARDHPRGCGEKRTRG